MKKKLFFLVCIFFVIGLTLLGKIYAAEVYVPSPNNVNPLKVPAVTSADSVLCDKLNLAKEEMRILKDYKEKIVLKKGKLVKVLEPIYEYIGKGGAKLWKGRQNQK